MSNSTTPMPRLFKRYVSYAAVLQEFAPVAFFADRNILPLWYVIGFLGNPISAYIWLSHVIREGNSSAIYLGALTISDMIFLIIHFMSYLNYSWGQEFYVSPITCEIFSFSFHVPRYMSYLLVFQFTFERYISVCHPFLKYKLFSLKRTINIILFFIIFSIALSSSQIYIIAYDPEINKCVYRISTFKKIFTIISEGIVVFGISFLVLLLNSLVLYRIHTISKNETSLAKGSKQINQTVSTANLLGVSFYFLIAQLTLSIVSTLENWYPAGEETLSDVEIRRDKKWSFYFTYIQIRTLTEALCMSYYASHIFIFCLTSKYFRLVLVYLFTCKGMMPYRDSVITETRSSSIKMTMSTSSRLKLENEKEECIILEKRKQERNTMMPTIDEHITKAHIATYSTEV